MPKENHPQADGRRGATFTDQYGRHYSATVEKSTGHPVGGLTPVVPPKYSVVNAGQQEALAYDAYAKENRLWPYAPFMPDPKYVEPQDNDGSSVYVNGPDMLRDYEEAHRTYWTFLSDTARVVYKDRYAQVIEEVRGGGEVPVGLAEIVGKPPLDLRIIKTAIEGKSRWINGLADPATGEAIPRPQWADEIFPEPVVTADEFFSDEAFSDQAWNGEPDSIGEDESPVKRRGRPRRLAEVVS